MIIKIKHFFAYFENFFKPCAFYFGLLSVLIFKPKFIIIISMKFLTKTVTIDTAEIVDENRINHYEPKANVWRAPDRRLRYTVELCRQKFQTYSINQKYSVGERASVMLKDGKCELLYDSVFYNVKPFTVKNDDLTNLDYYVLKKGLKSEKRRRAALKSSPKIIASHALIIQRKSYGEWQVHAKGYVRFKLTLLLKSEKGYFITTFSDWDKTERFGSILRHVFDLSVGEIVPVLYNADNPADIIVDYEQNFKK